MSASGNMRFWADLVRELRDRFKTNLPARPYTPPWTADLIGKLAVLILHCEHLAEAIDVMGRHDPVALRALTEAMERTDGDRARSEQTT